MSRKPAPPAMPPAKVAVTLFDWFISTVQVVARPPQAPVQPVKVAPVAGEAISVTVAFRAKFAEQMTPPLPQLIAPVPPLTLPLPVTVTVSFGSGAKVAVTLRDDVHRQVALVGRARAGRPRPSREHEAVVRGRLQDDGRVGALLLGAAARPVARDPTALDPAAAGDRDRQVDDIGRLDPVGAERLVGVHLDRAGVVGVVARAAPAGEDPARSTD